MHAEDDRLARQRRPAPTVSRSDCAVSIEIWSHGASASSGRNEYPAGPLVDDRGVAEADVHARSCPRRRRARGRAPSTPNSRAFSGRACMYGSSICTMSAPAANRSLDLLVDGGGVGQRQLVLVVVVVVLRLLRHRERARHGDLDRCGSVLRAQELHVAHLRPGAARRIGPTTRGTGFGWPLRSSAVPGCRCRRPRARSRSGWSSSRAASRRR